LVVGCNTKPDQPEWDRQTVDDVDPHIFAELFLRGFCCVIASRPRPDYRDMPHVASPELY
jgi:hypothetical protein